MKKLLIIIFIIFTFVSVANSEYMILKIIGIFDGATAPTSTGDTMLWETGGNTVLWKTAGDTITWD